MRRSWHFSSKTWCWLLVINPTVWQFGCIPTRRPEVVCHRNQARLPSFFLRTPPITAFQSWQPILRSTLCVAGEDLLPENQRTRDLFAGNVDPGLINPWLILIGGCPIPFSGWIQTTFGGVFTLIMGRVYLDPGSDFPSAGLGGLELQAAGQGEAREARGQSRGQGRGQGRGASGKVSSAVGVELGGGVGLCNNTN